MTDAKILICEDEGIVAKDLQNRLQKMGYSVVGIVYTGQDALEKVTGKQPDLVLMDIRLKGQMDGVETAKHIQERFGIPVIYLTAYADEDTLNRVKETQPFGYILKPFKEKELLATIEITLSKYRIERKLQEREKWLTTVLQSIADAAIATDLQGKITLMNRAAEDLTGWKQQDVLDTDICDRFPLFDERTQTDMEHPVTRALKENQIVFVPEHTVLIAKDGQEIPIKDSAAPIADEKGKIIGAVWVFRDISFAKQAQKALRESEARARRLVESNIIGIAIADFNGNLLQANDAFLEIVGHDRQDFLAGKVRWSDMTPHDDAPTEESAIAQVRTTGTCSPFEKQFIRPDGSCVSVLVGMALLESSENCFVAFVLDITERKRLETALLKQAAELAKASRMKDEFLGVVSHELRTPLNAMLGWAQLLRHRKLNDATMEKALESIERNAKAQVKIIDEILDASRIVRGKMRLNLAPIDSIALLDDAIADIRPTAQAKAIHLEFHHPEAIAPILGDSERLHQVFWHLLSNSIKFTPIGGRVSVTLDRVNAQAHIRFSDTGMGISRDFLPFVFDTFRQADSTTTRANGGLGLGLALVRHLVELHGGSVSVSSEGEGLGATFRVELPLIQHLNETASSEPPISSISSQVPLEGLRVMLVDDDLDTCELICFALEQYGAEVMALTTATEALDAIARTPPHLLISDIGMPQHDGYWLIRQVRSLDPDRGGSIPAIALTAFTSQEDRIRALNAGFQMHVSKPIEPEELVSAIAKLALI